MVAVIKTGHSIHRIVNYNENKISDGVAECIGEGNYPMDINKMGLAMRLSRLVNQAALNENVTRKSVHISLNFDPSEKDLDNDRLMAIANEYMERIGFGEQPYLVYRHHDAGHPHIHIVSIKVRDNGRRIDMQNIGRNQSEAARKVIEQQFGLVAAEAHKRPLGYVLKPVDASRITYGKAATKRAVTNVLEAVVGHYKYTSLAELNAVLGQYNVLADRGSENSRIYKGHGLVYRVVDNEGKPIGVPIKASDFYSTPTLAVLEKRFPSNEVARTPHKARIKNAVDHALLGGVSLTLDQLAGTLEKEGISMVIRQNALGLVYGITYVDHTTKCVFNGSALGKAYSAKAVLQRCNPKAVPVENKADMATEQRISGAITAPAPNSHGPRTTAAPPTPESTGTLEQAVASIMGTENTFDHVPAAFRRKKKKKKRKGN